jgi:hypothetical protein
MSKKAKSLKAIPPAVPADGAPVEKSDWFTREDGAYLLDLAKKDKRLPVFKRDADNNNLTPDAAHLFEWTTRMCQIFGGISSVKLASSMALELANCMPGSGMVEKINAGLAGVDSIAPRDPVEAMLASQMWATHHAAMMMLKRLNMDQPSLEVYDSISNRANKLMRTFTAQVETLNRYRNAGKQNITVQHQHIGIAAEHANIAVGCTTGGGGGSLEKGKQAHDKREIAHACVTPLLGQDPSRDALPVPRDGKRQVQAPRRSLPGRATGRA